MTETYGELSRLFGDYYALSVTQLFAFGDKHAAFERNGNMSLFEKFELAREVSEICDSIVPLIKVVIVEGGKRTDGGGNATTDNVVAAVRAAAAGHRRSCGAGCWDGGDAWHSRDGDVITSRPSETCKNPFGAIMEDDVDGKMALLGRPKNVTAAGKCIELEVFSRSVSYFHERADDDKQIVGRTLVGRSGKCMVTALP